MWIPFILGGLGIASSVYKNQENQEQIRNAKEQYYHEYERQKDLLSDQYDQIFDRTNKAEIQAKNELYYELESRGISSSQGVGARYSNLIRSKSLEVLNQASENFYDANKMNLENLQDINRKLGEKRDEININFIGSLFSSALGIGGLTAKMNAFDEFREKNKLSDAKVQRFYQSLLLGGAGSLLNGSLSKKDKNGMYSLPNIFDFNFDYLKD